MVGFRGCKCTFLGHVELLINQHSQVFLLRAALNPFSAQPVFVLEIAPTRVQDLALGLVELHEVCMGPLLKPVKVPLDGTPSLQHVDCTTQLGVISKLAEGALNPTVPVADKDRPLRNVTHHWSPLGHGAIDCNSLSVTIQPIPYPLSGPSVKSISLQFRDKDVVRDSLKCFAQVQGSILRYSTKQIPEEAKVCSPEVQGSELAVHPPWCPKDLELHCFMVTVAKAALELHIPHQPLLVGQNKVQHSTSPHWLLCHLEKEVINTFQELPGLLMPCCVVPTTDIGAELHALQLVTDIEGDILSLSPLPVLPKEPVSFHSNSPVIGAIPPRLHDASKIIALQTAPGCTIGAHVKQQQRIIVGGLYEAW
ncbi:hypothetical protein QYF61_012527 [Mycteria americana]|uniref:Uncharacterized protein n=1 Tax=Mycteria americana TaxID=33587 RepID=A0AAN7NG29_MYCAM|nr:hypothetical protein QYF61_012527 [Mycteria americana]